MTTEQHEAAQHLRGITELLYPNKLWSIAQHQTYVVSATVGKFGVAPDRLRDFEAAVRAHQLALRQARGRSRREAPRTLGKVAESGLVFAQRPSLAIRGVVEDAEDVRGQVVAELLALRGDAIPCARCPRRFDMHAFRAEAEVRAEAPEQLQRLEELEGAHRAGRLQAACPALWWYLGIRPPWRPGVSLPYGRDADIVQSKEGRRIVVCRALGLARQYSRRSAIRVLYHKAKASPTDQLDGRARNTTEEEVVARITVEEVVARLTADAPSRRRRAFTAIASCVAELGRAPSSDELRRALGISRRTAQRHLRAWQQLAEAIL